LFGFISFEPKESNGQIHDAKMTNASSTRGCGHGWKDYGKAEVAEAIAPTLKAGAIRNLNSVLIS